MNSVKQNMPLVKHAKFLIKELSATLKLLENELNGGVEEKMNDLIKLWKEIRG